MVEIPRVDCSYAYELSTALTPNAHRTYFYTTFTQI